MLILEGIHKAEESDCDATADKCTKHNSDSRHSQNRSPLHHRDLMIEAFSIVILLFARTL